jgi:transcriptional regulator with XRE-family HTH domain
MRLRTLRKARKLNQADLGEMIGMDQSTVQRAEAMDDSAKLSTYIKLAKVLNVTLAELFMDDRTTIEADLVAAFRNVPPDRRAEWVQVLRLASAPVPSITAETTETDRQTSRAPRQ